MPEIELRSKRRDFEDIGAHIYHHLMSDVHYAAITAWELGTEDVTAEVNLSEMSMFKSTVAIYLRFSTGEHGIPGIMDRIEEVAEAIFKACRKVARDFPLNVETSFSVWYEPMEGARFQEITATKKVS